MVASVLSCASSEFPGTDVLFRGALREKQLKSLTLCCPPSCVLLSCHVFSPTSVKGFKHLCRMVEKGELINTRCAPSTALVILTRLAMAHIVYRHPAETPRWGAVCVCAGRWGAGQWYWSDLAALVMAGRRVLSDPYLGWEGCVCANSTPGQVLSERRHKQFSPVSLWKYWFYNFKGYQELVRY